MLRKAKFDNLYNSYRRVTFNRIPGKTSDCLWIILSRRGISRKAYVRGERPRFSPLYVPRI